AIDSAKVTGELLTSIFAALAQTESESISGNMRWSYRKRMEAGTFVPPCLPYGYRREKGRIVREPAEAAVVCRIFEAFLAGASSVEIASELTVDRIPCRFGKGRWHSTVVRQILSNEKYTGNSLWQKYYTTEHLPFRKHRNHGEREQFYAVDTHEALISPETFQAAQQRLLCQRQRTGGAAREESVFRKKIRCACGGRMRRKRVRQIDYWVCVAHDEGGDCPLTQIPESQVQEAFLCLFHRLKHGTALLSQLLVELRAVQERAVSCHPDIALLNQQIADCKDQRRMLAEMNRVGLIDADLYLTQNNQIAAQLHKVKEQKRRILAQHHDDTLSKTEALIELLETMPDFLSEFDDEIFAEIVSRITVESNTALRFHLINGLELTESIERTRRS
ncbi:MAG: recombinase family protein, partial [Clostridia bacterium]|nr:recombinase family protein [Clostridia bacterium]